MQVKRRLNAKKLKDSLLEGGDDEVAPEKEMVKAEKRQWQHEKEQMAKEFSVSDELKRGVVKNRGCTDIICLLLYVIFLCGMVYCCVLGYSRGNVRKIMSPIDRNGHFCGTKEMTKDGKVEYDLTGLDYLYWPEWYEGTTAKSFSAVSKSSFCVDKCPGLKEGTKAEGLPFKCPTTKSGVPIDTWCKDGASVGATHATRTLVTFCLPKGDLESSSKEIWNTMLADLQSGSLGRYLYDILVAASPIGISVATSFLYCVVFIGVLSLFAEPLCWLCIIVVELGLMALPVVFGWRYYTLKQELASVHDSAAAERAGAEPKEGEKAPISSEKEDILSGSATINLMLAIGIGCACICFSLCLYFFYSSLKRAIDVVDASADFVMATKRILLIPFAYFLLSVIIIFVWIGGYLMVASMNEIHATKGFAQVRTVTWTNDTIIYAVVMWFGLLWSLMVIDYAKNFIILYGASTYYYNSPKCELDDNGDFILDGDGDPKLLQPEEDGSAEVMQGVRLAHFKHLGSICFGALIITIIRVIRFLFVYVAEKMLEATGEKDSFWGKIVMCMIKCADCILACIEKIVDYINNAAFAYMAITGKNFCSSAWDGMLLNTKWAASFSAAKFFATSLIFLGKLAITLANVFTFFVIAGAMLGESNNRNAPATIVAIMTWFATEIWLSVFDKAILGIMTSLAVDTDLNNGEACRGPDTFKHKRAVFDGEGVKGNDTAGGANTVQEGGQYEMVAV